MDKLDAQIAPSAADRRLEPSDKEKVNPSKLPALRRQPSRNNAELHRTLRRTMPTLTSRGQVTLRKEILDHPGLRPGDKLGGIIADRHPHLQSHHP
ncbi:MAG TPA: AbrB/MazE/SpoVT family DNA-binding domain-containing protein [Ramlibacter sp.]|uniref:AbrB/MazE/SpoVT family DNA-binding domain-containing protein n=1 Tax=Ramlibacter sp. TaxID=1917967 RepID=UPI002C5F9171|nr:AbrB/MazE/SpoVT family DNA-binding domain-containing protein [Ramlibacter sp.]HVZ43441.1 AbrB/MazE/SpoVT family DNA-binding domain-containing protein [Ramlibacter sp.]